MIVFDDKQLFEQLYSCSNNCFVVCLFYPLPVYRRVYKSIIQDKTPSETWESPEAPDTTHLVDSMMKRSAPSSLGKTTSHTSLGKTTSAPQTLASR